MLRYPDYTRTRLKQLADRMQGKIYPERRPADRILVSPRVDRITWKEAQNLKYRPARLGEQFGPAWATYWFRVSATVPKEWKGRRVDLQWISHSEATLWINGRSTQGLNWYSGDRPDAILIERARGGEKIELQIEMACNNKFGINKNRFGVKNIQPWILDVCDISVFDPVAWEMYYDFQVLQALEADMAKDCGAAEKTWAGELLYELNRFANEYDMDDRSTWARSHKILKNLYTRKNGTQAHELSAIGHAHIDTAWLWPLAETWRKCERTFSSATAYMEDYAEYKFSCSQAAQYEVIKQRNPDLYRRIAARVKKGQWVPVGGTWIEPDCNIPSGEALARQFLYGQKFFENEFGIRCKEFWNPDVFGYNGQLPQIMKQAGITRFLTQKLSWNRFNKPHHHTFTWQGIDGSEVLAHFPPADTYNAMADVPEIRRNARDYKDHDRSRHSLMLFGWGDGGGGPTKRMLETLRRVKDLQGLPRTQIRSSNEFFELLEKDIADRPLMVGELYFEYHRGTYTTQAANKRDNRKCEFLLHEVEFLAAIASKTLSKFKYPTQELARLWKLVLLNQFHDILPGSSITQVYEDSAVHYADVIKSATQLRENAAAALSGRPARDGELTPINTIGFYRRELATAPDGKLTFVEAPSYGIGRFVEATDTVSVVEQGKNVVLENEHLRATLARDGRLISLIEKTSGRESLSAAGNVLKIYDDRPTAYDAWDVDPFYLETAQDCPPADSYRTSVKRAEGLPLRGEVIFERRIGRKSVMKQVVRLDAHARRLEFYTDVDWQEDNKFLKVAFPINARAMNATYETQFGSVERPTHYNTMYDLAKFEVPGHKWADLSEHGFGVALLTESKYGYHTFGNTMHISLLRSPKHPDPKADMGKHHFVYAIMPHAGSWRDAGVVAESYRFNVPVMFGPSTSEEAGAARSYFSVDDPNLILDTVKKAEDSDDLILRLYEAHGARGVAHVTIDVPFRSAVYCNLLEDEGKPAKVRRNQIEVPYGPYEIISLKLK